MEYRTLGATGLRVSRLGFGASPLGNEFGDAGSSECTRAVHAAIDLGINYFDVAPYYGRGLAEERLGSALEGRRDSIVLATKCGRYGPADFDFSAVRVAGSVEESLLRLRTDYIDLLQVHDVEFGDRAQLSGETLPALREMQRQGKVRYIGVTGYQLRMLRQLSEEPGVDVVLSYCRYNLFITDMDRLLTPSLRERGLGLINASPLLMGVLTDQGAPAWHPAAPGLKQAGAVAAAVCRRRGIAVSGLALQFCLDHPYVSTTLVGMSTAAQVEENVRVAAAPVDTRQIEEIRQLLAPVATPWPSGKPENEDYAENAGDRRAPSLLDVQR